MFLTLLTHMNTNTPYRVLFEYLCKEAKKNDLESFHLTDKEIARDTGLKANEIRNARRKCKEFFTIYMDVNSKELGAFYVAHPEIEIAISTNNRLTA
jgi:hypothetical protein